MGIYLSFFLDVSMFDYPDVENTLEGDVFLQAYNFFVQSLLECRLAMSQMYWLKVKSHRFSSYGCWDLNFSNNPCHSPVIGHSSSFHSSFVPNR